MKSRTVLKSHKACKVTGDVAASNIDTGADCPKAQRTNASALYQDADKLRDYTLKLADASKDVQEQLLILKKQLKTATHCHDRSEDTSKKIQSSSQMRAVPNRNMKAETAPRMSTVKQAHSVESAKRSKIFVGQASERPKVKMDQNHAAFSETRQDFQNELHIRQKNLLNQTYHIGNIKGKCHKPESVVKTQTAEISASYSSNASVSADSHDNRGATSHLQKPMPKPCVATVHKDDARLKRYSAALADTNKELQSQIAVLKRQLMTAAQSRGSTGEPSQNGIPKLSAAVKPLPPSSTSSVGLCHSSAQDPDDVHSNGDITSLQEKDSCPFSHNVHNMGTVKTTLASCSDRNVLNHKPGPVNLIEGNCKLHSLPTNSRSSGHKIFECPLQFNTNVRDGSHTVKRVGSSGPVLAQADLPKEKFGRSKFLPGQTSSVRKVIPPSRLNECSKDNGREEKTVYSRKRSHSEASKTDMTASIETLVSDEDKLKQAALLYLRKSLCKPQEGGVIGSASDVTSGIGAEHAESLVPEVATKIPEEADAGPISDSSFTPDSEEEQTKAAAVAFLKRSLAHPDVQSSNGEDPSRIGAQRINCSQTERNRELSPCHNGSRTVKLPKRSLSKGLSKKVDYTSQEKKLINDRKGQICEPKSTKALGNIALERKSCSVSKSVGQGRRKKVVHASKYKLVTQSVVPQSRGSTIRNKSDTCTGGSGIVKSGRQVLQTARSKNAFQSVYSGRKGVSQNATYSTVPLAKVKSPRSAKKVQTTKYKLVKKQQISTFKTGSLSGLVKSTSKYKFVKQMQLSEKASLASSSAKISVSKRKTQHAQGATKGIQHSSKYKLVKSSTASPSKILTLSQTGALKDSSGVNGRKAIVEIGKESTVGKRQRQGSRYRLLNSDGGAGHVVPQIKSPCSSRQVKKGGIPRSSSAGASGNTQPQTGGTHGKGRRNLVSYTAVSCRLLMLQTRYKLLKKAIEISNRKKSYVSGHKQLQSHGIKGNVAFRARKIGPLHHSRLSTAQVLQQHLRKKWLQNLHHSHALTGKARQTLAAGSRGYVATGRNGQRINAGINWMLAFPYAKQSITSKRRGLGWGWGDRRKFGAFLRKKNLVHLYSEKRFGELSNEIWYLIIGI